MVAIVLMVAGALGLVGSVALFSWKAALVVLAVELFALGVDLGRTATGDGSS